MADCGLCPGSRPPRGGGIDMIPPPAPLVRGQSPCTHRGSGPSPHFLPDVDTRSVGSVISCQVVSLGYQRVGCAGDLVVPAYVGGAGVPTTLARRCGVSLWLRPRSGPEVSNYRTRLMQRRSTVCKRPFHHRGGGFWPTVASARSRGAHTGGGST